MAGNRVALSPGDQLPPAVAARTFQAFRGEGVCHATLLEPDALAFLEALEHVLAPTGLAAAFTTEECGGILTYAPDVFVTSPRLEQRVLADASATWRAGQTNRGGASAQERRVGVELQPQVEESGVRKGHAARRHVGPLPRR